MNRFRRHHRTYAAGAHAGALLGSTLAVMIAAPATSAAVALAPPVVRTATAVSVTQTSATLTGTINPGGTPTTYFFQYGPTTAYGRQTQGLGLVSGSGAVPVSAPISGLTPRTVYHFRLVAVNALARTLGGDAAFTTAAPVPPPPKPPVKPPVTPTVRPVVRTGGALAVTSDSALLSGTVNPSGQATRYFFQYGQTARYGSQTAAGAVAAGGGTVAVRSPIAGLHPLARYHYRLVAANAAGTTLGGDVAFVTRSVALSVAIGGFPNPVTFGAPLSVAGTISGTGAPGRSVALQENPFPFTGGFRSVGNPELASGTGAFSFSLGSLPATTQFRALSTGGGRTIVSSTLTERVALAVAVKVAVRRTRSRSYRFVFSGLVSPAEDGGFVSLQRLFRGRWRRVHATTAQPSAPGSSSFVVTSRRRHGGFFRVFVAPVEGGHVPGVSRPQLVHARATA